jgi:DNA-directed RNA polymerase specialized sigma24 family protein
LSDEGGEPHVPNAGPQRASVFIAITSVACESVPPHQRREALARRESGETLTEIARTFGVSHTTIGRL